jgi:hypothetical protein
MHIDPQELGLAILKEKEQLRISVCDAADRVFANMENGAVPPRPWKAGDPPPTPRESVQ